MARKITCFVSFSTVDGQERDIRLLLDHLAERLQEKVAFKAYFDQRSGSDLQRFMKDDLKSADAVMALFTPDYKHKADQRAASGVRTEFLRIVERLDAEPPDPFLFIPVFWGGPSFETAVPSFVYNRYLARELPKFQALGTTGQPYLARQIEAEVKPEIDRIVGDLILRWLETDPEYDPTKDRIHDIILPQSEFAHPADVTDSERTRHDVSGIMSRKFERSPITLEEFNDHFFVNTAAFRAIGLYHKMAFTGRKGSGKTTLLKIYKYQNRDRYLSPIDVEVNDWNLHYILGDLTFRPAEGDLSYTAEESKIFDFIWPIFLSLCLVRSLCTSLHVKPNALIVSPKYVEIYEASASRYDAMFTVSIDVVRDFIQFCIDSSSTNSEVEFKADLLKKLNVQACTEFLLGPRYEGIVTAANSDPNNRRFLFCLDRFDTEIQKYRKDLKERNATEEERKRSESREVFWIQGLVEMIDHLRSPDYLTLNQAFYKIIGPMVDFCVPLPKDRLYEVQLRRRDSVVGDINEEINWQPYELLTMLRKRLQAIWEISDAQIDKTKCADAKQRFERLLELCPRNLPKVVDITINSGRFSTDLFLDVLRHTFFRPRDILIYYERIVIAVEVAHKRSQVISSNTIKRLISEQTYKIVDDEFIGEFADTFKNLRDVLHRFRGATQLMDLSEISERLNEVAFEIYGEDNVVDVGKKIRLLYEIGFIGVCSAGGQLGSLPTTDYDFYFFNPRVAEALEQRDVLLSVKFAIHPIFIEYLTLRLNSTTPVLMLDWQMVDELDAFH